ncbi:radical SAM/SPASM domain-containing protein [Patescibacteria group bacterium]
MLVNRLKLLKNYLKKQAYASHHPVKVGIEITNRCNLNCIMCSRNIMKRPEGDISLKLFKKIVDQTYKKADIYALYGLGEPLLNPHLFKMIDYCHKKGVPVTLSTNAVLLNKNMAEKLIKHPPDHLLFALDAHQEKTYQKIRGGKNLKQIQKNIRYYLKRRQKKNPPTFATLLFVKQDLNQKEVKTFQKYWQNKGISNIHIKPVAEKINLKVGSSQPRQCLSPWRHFIVTWQGEVHTCCLDTNGVFKLGNIKNQSFKSIWNGPAWQSLRLSFKTDKLKPLCRSCTLRQPSLLGTIILSFFPELTIKKTIPYIDQIREACPGLISKITR